MLLFEITVTEVAPVTVLLRLTPPPVAVRETVSPVIVPVVLVMLVAATMLNAPPDARVPACELPDILMVPAELRKMPSPAAVVFAETLAAATLRGDPTLVPMVPAVEVRFNVGVVINAVLVMLL